VNAHAESLIVEAAQIATAEQTRPSVLYRPTLKRVVSVAGERWVATCGDLVAFGDSPDAAMRAFDAAWTAKIADAVPA
jgi:hypothetical protein